MAKNYVLKIPHIKIITVNGWCTGGFGGDGKRFRSKLFPTFSWKKLSKETLTTEAGSVLQYFTTLTEIADPLLRRWLEIWSTL